MGQTSRITTGIPLVEALVLFQLPGELVQGGSQALLAIRRCLLVSIQPRRKA